VEQGSDDPDRSNGGTPELPDCPCALVDANKDCSRGVRPQFRQRVGALLLKRFHYGRRDFKLPVLMIFLPLAVLSLFVWINQTHISRALNYSGLLQYDLALLYGNSFAFYAADDNIQGGIGNAYARLLESEGGAKVVHLDGGIDPKTWLEAQARENYQLYRNHYFIGAQFKTRNRTQVLQQAVIRGTEENDVDDVIEVTAWHSGFSPQSAAVSLTCATWAFLPGWHMRVANHPLPKERPGPEPTPLVVLITRLTCGVFVPVGLAFLAAAYVLFPERVRNVKLLQLLAGATSAAFWGSALLVDIVVHAVCSAVLLLPFVVFDWHGLYSDSATLGFVFLLMLVYGWASIPLAYVSSLVCDRPSTGYVAIASLSIVAGLVLNTAMTLLYTLPLLDPPTDNSSSENPGLDLALTAFRFIPSFALTWGLSNCLQNSQERVMCEYMSTFDRLLFCNDSGFITVPDHLNRFRECCPAVSSERSPQAAGEDRSGGSVTTMSLSGALRAGVCLIGKHGMHWSPCMGGCRVS
ncbi:hypothetical protein HPB47_023820, partial [Ixodes persulcatus]